jgi:hypothetical protein
MKYAVEMSSGVMVYAPTYIKLSHSKIDRGDIQTPREHGDLISLFLFFQIEESRLKINCHFDVFMHLGYLTLRIKIYFSLL